MTAVCSSISLFMSAFKKKVFVRTVNPLTVYFGMLHNVEGRFNWFSEHLCEVEQNGIE